MQEILDLINEKDEVIGKASREEVKTHRLLYRCAGVYLERNGKVAIEKRSAKKAIRPGNYSLIEETVKSGESFEEAARRGVKEELGLEVQDLKFLGKKIIIDDNYPDSFMLGVFMCNGAGRIKLQKSEVEKVQFLSPKEVQELIKKEKKISPGLCQTFRMYLEGQK
ncbi:MAG TPA: NUDIX domain-containing protein [archaeon]|nr:NUDIX domain-containing protein [archaeon]